MVEKPNRKSSMRWLILSIISTLHFFTSWVQFSVSPNSSVFQDTYEGLDSSKLVVIFLVASFSVGIVCTSIFRLVGTKIAVIFASFLLFTGNLVKSGVPFYLVNHSTTLMYVGFGVAGASQPIIKTCMLETISNWFPTQQRDTAIGIAISAGSIGISLSFFIGAYLVNIGASCVPYLNVMTFSSFFLFGVTAIFYSDKPVAKEAARGCRSITLVEELSESTFLLDWKQGCEYLRRPGFPIYVMLTTFGNIIAVNVATYLEEIYGHLKYTLNTPVAIVGGSFFVISLLSGSQLGKWKLCCAKPEIKELFGLIMVLICASTLLVFGMVFFMFFHDVWTMSSVFLIAAVFVGPLKAIGTTLTTDVVYPTNEIRLAMVIMLLENGFTVSMVYTVGEFSKFLYGFSIMGALGIFITIGTIFNYKVISNHVDPRIPTADPSNLEEEQASSLEHALIT